MCWFDGAHKTNWHPGRSVWLNFGLAFGVVGSCKIIFGSLLSYQVVVLHNSDCRMLIVGLENNLWVTFILSSSHVTC
jgi:hypothetical protein